VVDKYSVTTCKNAVFCRQLWESGTKPCPTIVELFNLPQNFHLQLLTMHWCDFHSYLSNCCSSITQNITVIIIIMNILVSFCRCQILYQVGKENEAFKQFRSLLRKYPEVCYLSLILSPMGLLKANIGMVCILHQRNLFRRVAEIICGLFCLFFKLPIVSN